MPRGKPGIRGIKQNSAFSQDARATGDALNDEILAKMEKLIESFTADLRRFATHHEKDIQDNPVLRAKFHEMCLKLGVDPLTSRRGMWGKLMPTIGDFYYVLGTRIIEVCVATRNINGGILALDELLRNLRAHQDGNQENLSEKDIERAVKTLEILGSGFRIVEAGDVRLVQSVPVELNEDHTKVLNSCRSAGTFTSEAIQHELGWDSNRASKAIRFLMDKELAWIDNATTPPTYWVLGLVDGSAE